MHTSVMQKAMMAPKICFDVKDWIKSLFMLEKHKKEYIAMLPTNSKVNKKSMEYNVKGDISIR